MEQKSTVLIVDDAKVNRVLLNKVFCTEYHVLEAADGEDALSVMRTAPAVDAVVLDIAMPKLDGFGVLAAMKRSEALSRIPVIVVTASGDDETQLSALDAGARDVVTKPFNPQLVLQRVSNLLSHIKLALLTERAERAERELMQADTDPMTGLYNRQAFLRRLTEILKTASPGEYLLVRWDIDNFKVFNDVFGTAAGDGYLARVGRVYREKTLSVPDPVLVCRYDAEHFVSLRRTAEFDAEQTVLALAGMFSKTQIHPFEYVPRIGLYLIDDPAQDVTLMCDWALLALRSVKEKYGRLYAWFEPVMRESLVREHEIVGEMAEALKNREFVAYYQPQYNLTTGRLVGAEALVRWAHPAGGMIWPGDFIPLFEKNGFIFELDRYIWEQVCIFLSRRLEAGAAVVPVSVNVSRYDAVREEFFDVVADLTTAYHIPRRLLNLEITESAFSHDTDRIVGVVNRLREAGFLVEIDDFGSGYSSFNTLKDVQADVLKLDMKFLSDHADNQRGGTIIESIIRMAKWLSTPVIAEGVETRAQADFLRSIGCSYGQGYLFSRPVATDAFEALLNSAETEPELSIMETVAGMDRDLFWNPSSVDTLVFSSYVGGACVLEYRGGTLELIRMNESFLKLLKTAQSADRLLGYDVLRSFSDDRERKKIVSALQGCSTPGQTLSGVFHAEIRADKPAHAEYLRYHARMIVNTGASSLFYVLVENATEQVRTERKNLFLNELSGELLSEPDAEKVIGRMLQKLLTYFAGARAYVYEFDIAADTAGKAYECCAAGVAPICDAYSRVLLSAYPGWLPALQKHKHLKLEISTLSRDYPQEQRALCAAGIHTVLTVPLKRDGKLIGALSMDNPSENLDNFQQLEALGDYMTVLLTRRDLEKKIRIDNAQLTMMINDTPGGFARVQIFPDGSIAPIVINDAFCRLVGMEHGEVMTLYRTDVFAGVHPDDIAAARAQVRRSIENRGAFSLRLRLLCGDGSYVPVQAYYRVTEDADGGLYLNGYYADLRSQLSKEELRRELLENIPAGVALYEVSHAITPLYLNDNACALFGFTREEYDTRIAQGLPIHTMPKEDFTAGPQFRRLLAGEVVEVPYIKTFRKDGSALYIRMIARLVRRSSEPPLLYASLSDATAHVQTEMENERIRAELTAANRRYADRIRYTPAGVICYRHTNGTGTPEYVNAELWRMLGYDPETADPACLGEPAAIHPDDAAAIQSAIQKTLAGGGTLEENCRLRKRDGSFLFVNFKARYVPDSPDSGLLYGIFTDISRMMALDGQLRQEQREMETLIASSDNGVAQYLLRDARAVATFVSQGLARMLGYTVPELTSSLNRDLLETVFADDRERVRAAIGDAVSGKAPFSCQLRMLCKDGSTVWVSVRAGYIEQSNSYIASYADISELKALETQLLHEKLEMESIIDSISGGVAIYEMRPEGFFPLYVSKGVAAMTGRSEAEYRRIADGHFGSYIHPQDLPALSAAVRRGMETGEDIRIQYRVLRPDGRGVWVQLSGKRFGEHGGFPVLHAVFHNVSESTELYRRILDETDRSIFVVDRETREILYLNAPAASVFNISAAQASGQPCYRCLSHLDAPCPDCPLSGLTDAPLSGDSRRDGRQYRRRAVPIVWYGRAAVAVYLYDATKSLESQQRIEQLLRNVPGGLVIFRTGEGRMQRIYLSQSASAILGYASVEEAMRERASNPLGRVYPADLPGLYASIQDAAGKNKLLDFEYRIVFPSGQTHWVNLTANLAEQDGALYYYGIYSDITERKTADENARIAAQEYRLITEQSGRDYYRYFVKTRSLVFGEAVAAAFGMPAGTPLHPQALIDSGCIAPKSAEAWMQMFDAADHGALHGQCEICAKRADGQYRWYEDLFSAVFDNEGAPVSAVVSFKDCTDEREGRKLSAFERDAFFRALHQIYDLAFTCNLTQNTYRVVDAEDQPENAGATGGTFEELFRTVLTALLPEDQKAFTDTFCRAALLAARARGERVIRLEHRRRDRDGALHWVESVLFFADNPYDGDVLAIILTRSIDGQKENEEKLRQSLALTSGRLAERLHYGSIINRIANGLVLVYRSSEKEPVFFIGNLLTLYGYSDTQTAGLMAAGGINALVHPDDLAAVAATIRTVTQSQPTDFHFECRFLCANGGSSWVTASGTRFKDADAPGYVCVFVDNNEQHELREKLWQSEEELRFTLAQMGKMICRYDVRTRMLTVPPAYAALHGMSAVLKNVPDCVLQNDSHFATPDDKKAYMDFYGGLLAGEPSGAALVRFVTADHATVLEHCEYSSIMGADNRPLRAVIAVEDVTKQKQMEQSLRRQAELDGLTGIYNRATAVRLIGERLADPGSGNCLLVLLDLDELKQINDTFGHGCGDRALQTIASTLSAHFRSTDIVARIGGDEFLAFLPGVSDTDALRPSLSELAAKFGRAVEGQPAQLRIRCSMGCAAGVAGRDTFELLYRHADTALYMVKRGSKNDYVFFSPGMEICEP